MDFNLYYAQFFQQTASKQMILLKDLFGKDNLANKSLEKSRDARKYTPAGQNVILDEHRKAGRKKRYIVNNFVNMSFLGN